MDVMGGRRVACILLIGLLCTAVCSAEDKHNQDHGKFLQWDSTPECPDSVSGAAVDTQGRSWGWFNGKSCKHSGSKASTTTKAQQQKQQQQSNQQQQHKDNKNQELQKGHQQQKAVWDAMQGQAQAAKPQQQPPKQDPKKQGSFKQEAAPSALQTMLPTAAVPGMFAGTGAAAAYPTDPLTAKPGLGADPSTAAAGSYGANPYASYGAAAPIPGAYPAAGLNAAGAYPGMVPGAYPGAFAGAGAVPGALPNPADPMGLMLPGSYPTMPGMMPGAPQFPGAAMPSVMPMMPQAEMPGDGQMGRGGRTVIPGVTSMGANPNAEDISGAGSGLGSLMDTSAGSTLSTPTGLGGGMGGDPFSISSGSNMNGANGVLGMGTSASAMAGIGGGVPASGMASRRNRVASSSGSNRGSAGLVGVLLLIGAMLL